MTQKEIFINIQEVKRAETDAQLVAENVALQLQRRVGFRRVMKKAVGSAMKLGAKGIKNRMCRKIGRSGDGSKRMVPGRPCPSHTLRADIDFGLAESKTTYGIIGVKVWIFKGEIFPTKKGMSEPRSRGMNDEHETRELNDGTRSTLRPMRSSWILKLLAFDPGSIDGGRMKNHVDAGKNEVSEATKGADEVKPLEGTTLILETSVYRPRSADG